MSQDGETILQILYEMYSSEGKLMEIPKQEYIKEAYEYLEHLMKQNITSNDKEIVIKIIHALEKLTNDMIKIVEKCEDMLYGGFI